MVHPLSSSLRRSLLLKVISKPQPLPDDVAALLQLSALRILEAFQAQAFLVYLLEKDNLSFGYVHYAPTLWEDDPDLEQHYGEQAAKLKETALPAGTGIVGQVIAQRQTHYHRQDPGAAPRVGFSVRQSVTVPLVLGEQCLGALQVLNKELGLEHEPFAPEEGALLEEVAEYTAPLLVRMRDSAFKLDDLQHARFTARFTDNPLLSSVDELAVDDKLVEVVGDAIIRRSQIFPYKRLSPRNVAALVVNPLDYPAREIFQNATDLIVEDVTVAPANLVDALLRRYFAESSDEPELTPGTDMADLADVIGMEYAGGDSEKVKRDEEELGEEDSAPIIQLANRVIEDAYISGASDIHIEPMEYDLVVRYRIDGVCEEKLRLPIKVAGALIARLKVMSDLDIAEKRLPQDGRIVFKKFTKKNIDIDLRVAIGPMNFGEKVVMRILDKTKSALPITKLGFSHENLGRYRECIQQPYGMILHCGPTGSGKSMTLFSALREIHSPEINIQTAEDPIEYTIPGINQMQMHKHIGLTFASALRCYLRMDPDIILVGEIRDRETAEIAVEAALTGHLLLSTLHTNDAPSTVARLTDMDIEPFMISASLLVVCAQRLMRRVCKHCRSLYTPEGNEAEILARALDGWHGEIYRASESGCPNCGHNGYKGRVGIHELMVNNEELTKAINNGRETAELKRVAMRTGMKTLHQDSMLKVKEQITTVVEALANVPPDMITSDEDEAPGEAAPEAAENAPSPELAMV